MIEIKNRIQDSIDLKKKILSNSYLIGNLNKSIKVIVKCIRQEGKIMIAGNGGSAADAQHFAGELVGKFLIKRKALPAIALTTDTSIITSLSNDISYDIIFQRQLEAISKNDDVFIGLSTSGNSKNIIEAMKYCRENGIITIGITGETGGKMKELSDLLINVPSNETQRIQESHLMIYHIICEFVEQQFINDKES